MIRHNFCHSLFPLYHHGDAIFRGRAVVHVEVVCSRTPPIRRQRRIVRRLRVHCVERKAGARTTHPKHVRRAKLCFVRKLVEKSDANLSLWLSLSHLGDELPAAAAPGHDAVDGGDDGVLEDLVLAVGCRRIKRLDLLAARTVRLLALGPYKQRAGVRPDPYSLPFCHTHSHTHMHMHTHTHSLSLSISFLFSLSLSFSLSLTHTHTDQSRVDCTRMRPTRPCRRAGCR